ncbi:hypothetical protein POM88_003671 [Heracleum sosnowskyi]|uniref:Uncharacterized protein n=1 Tax=Heracleum sosnowskyi TaxID=360622 RepID=A0AAD8JK23_9APIA|nr:hypothetical protein POM88_003671 [Heracleum sosnowskyi]
MMRRPIFHKSRTPDQTQQLTQQRTPRTPELTQHSTPEMSQHHTPDQTPQNTPRQTPDPNTSGESSTSVINGAWKVGTMHDDGRIRVEVIEGVLEPSNKCSTQITSIMHERLEPKGFAWKSVSKDTKKFYFEEFKKWFILSPEDGSSFVSGRNSRNMIYGLGSSQDLFYAPSSSTIAHFSNSSHPNSQDYEKLQTELKVMKERMKEMDTMQQRMKDMENLLARMADNQMQ